jgi:hypothetical protein
MTTGEKKDKEKRTNEVKYTKQQRQSKHRYKRSELWKKNEEGRSLTVMGGE